MDMAILVSFLLLWQVLSDKQQLREETGLFQLIGYSP